MWGEAGVKAKVCAARGGRYNGAAGGRGMDDIRIISYEVYVLGRGGWEMHARHPNEDRTLALAEARTLEADMAAATRVVRSEYHPRSNSEDRREIYASRLGTDGRVILPAAAAPVAAPAVVRRKRKRRHVVHRRDMTPGAVLLRLGGIIAASAAIAGLITVSTGLFLDRLKMFASLLERAGQSLVYGVFLAVFLLLALPWIISFARQIEVVSVAAPGPAAPPARPPRRAAPPPPRPDPLALVDPLDTMPPIPPAEPLPLDDDNGTDDLAAADLAAGVPAMSDTGPNTDAAESGDGSAAADQRLAEQRRTLLRFLRRLVSDLRDSRPGLNSFERYGLGLLLAGAVDRVMDQAGLGAHGRGPLLREALGILGNQPGLVEAVEDGLTDTLGDPRSARILQAGRDVMTHFLAGSRDVLAAVLTALEAWNRPSGATGSGVVAAMLIQSWPDEEVALDLATEIAQARGGAVLGSVDGIALLFPGIARTLQAALELMPRLPAATRIGIDAAEAVTESEAVRAVGSARLLCHGARPGQILCSAAVRALGARLAGFDETEQHGDGGLPAYALRPFEPEAPEDESPAAPAPLSPASDGAATATG